MEIIEQKMAEDFDYSIKSSKHIYHSSYHKQVKFWSITLLIWLAGLFFLPWTQNIRATGEVTSRFQEQRPQQLNAIIPGRIIKWFVKEGDFVKKGDTLIHLADVKDDYLDPNLVERTEEQISAKQQKMNFYQDKVEASSNQIGAIAASRDLKIQSLQNKIIQLQRKVNIDSAEYAAAVVDKNIAAQQLARAKQMLEDGLISMVEFERRNGNYQKAVANETDKMNTLLNTRQELVIARIEINSVQQETADKIFKARGEQAGAQSEIASTIGEVAKLQNQAMNYRIRGSQRWLIAPQDGQVIGAKKAGINEIVKEGEMILQVVPNKVDYAVEMYVKPNDLVLIDTGQQVRFLFDGYPAIVFSGWPGTSYGTFAGKISAIESNRSSNGLFRVLVVEDKSYRPWPGDLKLGTGAVGFALLKEVPVWYELWRQINGFPADYYKTSNETASAK